MALMASYDLTRDDLAAFIEFHQRTSPAARKQKIGCLIVGVASLLVLPVGILLTTDKPRLATALDIWPLILGPILFAVLVIPYVRFRSRQMSNRLLSEGQNTGFYGECELRAGDDGLTETRPSGSTTRKWSSVERIETTPTHLFIYTSGIEAYVVPRRAFSTDKEFRALVDAIAEQTGLDVNAAVQ